MIFSSNPICRLCNDPCLAEQVVQLNGLRRLVELCKNEDARLGSDGVLVACLAAVRKVSMIMHCSFNCSTQLKGGKEAA